MIVFTFNLCLRDSGVFHFFVPNMDPFLAIFSSLIELK